MGAFVRRFNAPDVSEAVEDADCLPSPVWVHVTLLDGFGRAEEVEPWLFEYPHSHVVREQRLHWYAKAIRVVTKAGWEGDFAVQRLLWLPWGCWLTPALLVKQANNGMTFIAGSVRLEGLEAMQVQS